MGSQAQKKACDWAARGSGEGLGRCVLLGCLLCSDCAPKIGYSVRLSALVNVLSMRTIGSNNGQSSTIQRRSIYSMLYLACTWQGDISIVRAMI